MEMQEHLIAKEIAFQVDAAERSIENWGKKKNLKFLLLGFCCSVLPGAVSW